MNLSTTDAHEPITWKRIQQRNHSFEIVLYRMMNTHPPSITKDTERLLILQNEVIEWNFQWQCLGMDLRDRENISFLFGKLYRFLLFIHGSAVDGWLGIFTCYYLTSLFSFYPILSRSPLRHCLNYEPPFARGTNLVQTPIGRRKIFV